MTPLEFAEMKSLLLVRDQRDLTLAERLRLDQLLGQWCAYLGVEPQFSKVATA